MTGRAELLTKMVPQAVLVNVAHQYEMATKHPDWDRPESHLRHIAPITHAHINLKGTITFNLEQHRKPNQNQG